MILWNSRTGRVVCRLESVTFGLTAVAFSPDGRLLATSSDGRTLADSEN